jgi:hypothetical protein
MQHLNDIDKITRGNNSLAGSCETENPKADDFSSRILINQALETKFVA